MQGEREAKQSGRTVTPGTDDEKCPTGPKSEFAGAHLVLSQDTRRAVATEPRRAAAQPVASSTRKILPRRLIFRVRSLVLRQAWQGWRLGIESDWLAFRRSSVHYRNHAKATTRLCGKEVWSCHAGEQRQAEDPDRRIYRSRTVVSRRTDVLSPIFIELNPCQTHGNVSS